MQAGANPGNIDVTYTNSVNWTNREFLIMSGQPSTKADTLISDRAPAENEISKRSRQSVTIRLLAKKRAADTQPEDPDVEEGVTTKPPDLPASKYNPSATQTPAKTGHTRNQNGKNNITNSNKSGETSGIKNAIRKAQKRCIRRKRKRRYMGADRKGCRCCYGS